MTNGTYQYYAGNMVYKNDKSLNYLLMDEGMVNKSSGGYVYEYHLKDHLGNTRVAFQPNGTGTTLTQATEYYPFGMNYMPHSPAGSNRYLYNGKEKQDDVLSTTALDWYDYGARFYDPVIGRWHTPDPMAEWQFNSTLYQYARNNPMRFIDPNGLYDLDQVDVYGKKPSWIKRIVNSFVNLFKPGNGDSSYKGGIPFVTSGSSIDPTKDKAKHPDREVNIDDLLPAMTVPGGIPSGSLLGAEVVNKLSQASQEIWNSDSQEKATSDEEIIEKHGGTQEKETNDTVREKNNDSIFVKVTIWKNQNPKHWPWNVKLGRRDSVKIHRKDSAKTVKYYDKTTF